MINNKTKIQSACEIIKRSRVFNRKQKINKRVGSGMQAFKTAWDSDDYIEKPNWKTQIYGKSVTLQEKCV